MKQIVSNFLSKVEKHKLKSKKMVCVSAYDALTSKLLEDCNVDLILVGDSVGTALLGYKNTQSVSFSEILHHTKAVLRGVQKTPVIVDIPHELVKKGSLAILKASKELIRLGCSGIKLEWYKDALKTTKLLTERGIPVMGHIGITPQQIKNAKGYKVRGSSARDAKNMMKQAEEFEACGANSIVLECITASIASEITSQLKIPTIGIGSGVNCDGQILVFHDLIGLNHGFKPRFLREYANLHQVASKAVVKYVNDVKNKKYPSKKESYLISQKEYNAFKKKK